MGICYSQEEQWESYNQNYRKRRKNRKKNNYSSIIYEEKTIYESSFASKVESSFREDLHKTLGNLSSDNTIHIGSIVEMGEKELQSLHKSLQAINLQGEDFDINEVFTLCNLKTKNYMHTHKIKIPDSNKLNEVSACPYNSNHILQYDLWKLIKTQNNLYYIYHPFTQMFLNHHKDCIVCSPVRKQWKIMDFGRRRNGGFIKIIAMKDGQEVGQVCMMDQQALLPNHRKLSLCFSQHVSHLWEINFGQCMMN